MLHFLFRMVCVLGAVGGQLTSDNVYHVTPLINQPGLYYERVVALRLQHVDWRVTVFIDVEKFADDFPTDGKQIDELFVKCRSRSKLLFSGKCREVLQTEHLAGRLERARALLSELKTISRDSLLIKTMSPVSSTIVKRSVPLGFIGSVSKSLFGTMNEEDAEYINAQIDKLFSDQANLTQLIGKQMHITRSKLQELHEEHQVQTERVDQVIKRVNGLYKVLETVNNNTAELIFHSELVNYARHVEDKINLYIAACQDYLRVITLARDGRYDAAMLSTAQLLAISLEIQARAPEFEFPLTAGYLRGELLARLARADLTFHDGRILVVVHIPLLDRMGYQLYRMHPWPVPQPGINETGSAHIIPATNYIAVSADRRTYFLADDIYISACSKIEQKYICSMETPLQEVSTSKQCEIVMLTRPSLEAYRRCNVRIRPEHGAFWTHLPTQGGWLFSLFVRETVHVLCPGLAEIATTLEGAGIFHLSANCVGRTHTTALTGIRRYDSREQYFFTPDISLNVTMIVPEFKDLPQIMAQARITGVIDNKDGKITPLWKLQEDGESLFEVERRIKEIGTHRREKQDQQHQILAVFSFQGFLVIIFIIYLCRGRLCKNIPRLCALGKHRNSNDKTKSNRRSHSGRNQVPQVSKRSSQPYRFPRTATRDEAATALDSEETEITYATVNERQDKVTLGSPLPRQVAETE